MAQATDDIARGLMNLNAYVQSIERQLPVVRREISRLTVLAQRQAGFKARDLAEYPPIRKANDHR